MSPVDVWTTGRSYNLARLTTIGRDNANK